MSASTRLVNRCSSRFQSNHHRGYLRWNKIISSGAKKSTPPDRVLSRIAIGITKMVRKAVLSRLRGRSG